MEGEKEVVGGRGNGEWGMGLWGCLYGWMKGCWRRGLGCVEVGECEVGRIRRL